MRDSLSTTWAQPLRGFFLKGPLHFCTRPYSQASTVPWRQLLITPAQEVISLLWPSGQEVWHEDPVQLQERMHEHCLTPNHYFSHCAMRLRNRPWPLNPRPGWFLIESPSSLPLLEDFRGINGRLSDSPWHAAMWLAQIGSTTNRTCVSWQWTKPRDRGIPKHCRHAPLAAHFTASFWLGMNPPFLEFRQEAGSWLPGHTCGLESTNKELPCST